MQITRAALTAASAIVLIFTASCPKTASPPPPPSPSQLATPTIKFLADPATISNGQTAVLRWSVKDATSIQIDNQVGVVGPEDHRDIHPAVTTTYRLEASGNGKTTTASVTVSVVNPPTAVLNNAQPSAETTGPLTGEVFSTQLRDVHFAYSEHQVVSQDQPVLENDARVLKSFFDKDPVLMVVIEGHCDERGSAEYNMALGDLRANFIKESLVRLGVPANKLNTVTYGKEHPICLGTSDDCYAQNRRAHFSIAQ
jgi:peptidoglycan-associated lipoprotein